MIVEVMFSELFHLPNPFYLEIAYGSILVISLFKFRISNDENVKILLEIFSIQYVNNFLWMLLYNDSVLTLIMSLVANRFISVEASEAFELNEIFSDRIQICDKNIDAANKSCLKISTETKKACPDCRYPQA